MSRQEKGPSMLYLLLSILSSTAIILIFRLFPRYSVHTFQAIVFNYLTCFVCGWLALGTFPVTRTTLQVDWLPYSLLLGAVFIFTFNITARTVQHFGVTITSVMQRMSLLIVVPFAIITYQEPLPWLKAAGLLLALPAIVCTNLPDKTPSALPVQRRGWLWFLPLFLWLNSGVVEVLLLYVERQTAGNASLLFTTFIFGTAGLIGLLYVLPQILGGRMRVEWRNVLGGIFLGVPNFGSIFFILKALNAGWDGSVVFPVNSVTVIGLSALSAWLLFAEKLSKINILGVALAIIAIVLIALAR